ncbi:MAG: Rrf2 family transcriptional regulator [Cytophagaceae bacterium]|jgi:Rrf2 family protein|nr:Rrf2 family transcriptional regulator [Cytophagaceae bacterium]
MAYSQSFSKSILVLAFISDKIRRDETEYISASVMSDLMNIPKPTLTVIFSSFIRAGILESKEGIHGGVKFAKPEEKISLYEILTAIEGPKPLFYTQFEMKAKAKRPESLRKKVVESLLSAEIKLKKELEKTSLKDILDAS